MPAGMNSSSDDLGPGDELAGDAALLGLRDAEVDVEDVGLADGDEGHQADGQEGGGEEAPGVPGQHVRRQA
jgi:hypothetical protein